MWCNVICLRRWDLWVKNVFIALCVCVCVSHTTITTNTTNTSTNIFIIIMGQERIYRILCVCVRVCVRACVCNMM